MDRNLRYGLFCRNGKTLSNFFCLRVATHSSFYIKRYGDIPTATPPPTGASDAGGMKKSRFSTISRFFLTAGSNEPSTLGRYASDCVDRRCTIYKCRSATHQWSCRLAQMLLQKQSKMHCCKGSE